MTPYTPQTIAGIHKRLDRALEAELDRPATAHPAHQEERYRAGMAVVASLAGKRKMRLSLAGTSPNSLLGLPAAF